MPSVTLPTYMIKQVKVFQRTVSSCNVWNNVLWGLPVITRQVRNNFGIRNVTFQLLVLTQDQVGLIVVSYETVSNVTFCPLNLPIISEPAVSKMIANR